MRRIVFIMMFLLSTIAVSAQRYGQKPKFDPEKFEQEMETFVLKEMKLTQAEKTKFLPIYREMRKKEVVALKAEGDLSKMEKPKTDKEWAERMKKHDACQVQIKKIQQEYHLKMIKVVPAYKVMAMIRAEEDFHREAFKKFQGGKPPKKKGKK